MQKSLIPVNAVCSFCKRIPPWPCILYDAGYRIAGIDQPLPVLPTALVNLDVITLCPKSNCAILWECKSGANLGRDQLSRYKKFLQIATAKDIQRVAGIAFPEPGTARIEVAYCFLEEAVNRVLTAVGSEMIGPVVSLGPTTKLVAGSFSDSSVQEAFTAGFPTPPVEQVPWLIVADADTSDAEFARYLLPTLVSLIAKQPQRVSVTSIIGATLLDWEVVSLDTRRILREKAIRILKEICGSEFAEHFRFCKPEERRHEETIEIVSDIMGLEPSAQTRAFQKLRNLVEGAVHRLEEGRRFIPEQEPADQLKLFRKDEAPPN